LKEKIKLKISKELKKIIIQEAKNQKLPVDEFIESILIKHLEN